MSGGAAIAMKSGNDQLVVGGLGALLASLGFPASPKILDVGGAAFDGERTVRQTLEYCPSAQFDVLFTGKQSSSVVERKYATKVSVIRDLPRASGAYDVIMLLPTQVRLMASWHSYMEAYDELLKAGGYVVGLGIDPAAIGRAGTRQPSSDMFAAFQDGFGLSDNFLTKLPADLGDRYEICGYTPWSGGGQSYLSWIALRKAPSAKSPGAKKPQPKAATIKLPLPTIAPSSNSSPVANISKAVQATSKAGFLEGKIDPAVISEIPFKAATEVKAALSDVAFPAPSPEISTALSKQSFDTVMFVVNGFSNDPRVAKTAAAVASLGRKVLAVGLRGNADPFEYAFGRLSCGTQLLLLPNPNRSLTLALKARKLPLDRAPRHELWLAAIALQLQKVIGNLARADDFVLHTHDYHGLFIGGIAREALMGQSHRWFHDVHEFVRQYDIIDPALQAAGIEWEEEFIRKVDVLSTVSEELGSRLVDAYALKEFPRIIYSCNALECRRKYKGSTARESLGLNGKVLLTHSGTIVKGRGVDLVVKALPHFPDAHLLLITQSKNDYVTSIVDLARNLGVSERITFHPYLPFDEVMGFIADADVGLIPMDRYGNTDVALPNKLFDYVLAGVPILSSDATAMKRFLGDWPIGEVFEEKNEASLRDALGKLLGNLPAYRNAIRSRMDLVLNCAWETQMVKIGAMYSGGPKGTAI